MNTPTEVQSVPRSHPEPPGATETALSSSMGLDPPSTRSTGESMSVDTSPPLELPLRYYQCHMKDLVVLVSRFLDEIVALNDEISLSSDNLTRFHSRTPAPISVYDYLLRIIRFCSVDRAVLMMLLYFIDILSQSYEQFKVNSLTVHRFIITSVTVCCKGICDSFCTNSHYAKVGGIPNVELNVLEVEFLTRVGYKIVPPAGRLNQYFDLIMSRHSQGINFVAKGPLRSGPWAGLDPAEMAPGSESRIWTPPEQDSAPAKRPQDPKRSSFRAAVRGMSRFLNAPKKRRDLDEHVEDIDNKRPKS